MRLFSTIKRIFNNKTTLACLCALFATGFQQRLSADTVKLSQTSTTGFYSGADWGDGQSPISETVDYEVSGYLGLKARNETDAATPAASPLTFPGNSLRIGQSDDGTLYFPNGWATWYVDFPRDGLVLTRGQIQFQAASLVLHLLGTVTVDTASGRTFAFDMAARKDTSAHLDAKLVGDASAALAFRGSVSGQKVYLTGDMDDYQGAISIENPAMSVTLGSAERIGALSIASNVVMTTVSADTVFRTERLAFSDNVKLLLKTDPDTGTNAQFVATDSFSVSGKVYVTASDYFVRTGSKARPGGAAWETAGDEWRSPLVTAPQGQIDKSAFVFTGFTTTHNESEGSVFYGGCFQAHFDLVENTDGTETLYFVQEPIVNDVCTTQQKDYSRSGYGEYSSCTNAADWSDGRLPHEGAHYLVSWHSGTYSKTGSSFTPYFVTPQNVDDYVFPGATLTVGSHAHLASARSVTMRKLRIANNGKVYFYRDGFTFSGGIETVGTGDHYLYATEERRVRIEGDLTGVGTLFVGGQAQNGGWYIGGEIEFAGSNRGFAGRLVLTNFPKGGAYPDTNERVFLNSSDDFGAELPSFDFDAVTVTEKASLRPQTDIVLSYENRGLLVQGTGDVTVVEGRLLTLAMPVTYAGQLSKLGGGTLAFANQPRFEDGGQSTLPQKDRNVLDVREGAVQALGPDAFKGVEVRFSEGAALRFSATPTGEIADTGVRLEAASSFSTASRILVTVDATTLPSGGEVSIPLFTMPRAELDALIAKCRFARPARGCRMKCLAYVGDALSTTVTATYSVNPGFCLILR